MGTSLTMVSLFYILLVVSLVLPHVFCKLPTLDLSDSNSISPSKADLLSSLETEGLLVFSGLGAQYTAALQQLRENGPECVDSALQVTLEDGSERLTLARDTETDTGAFPHCVNTQTKVIGQTFDRVDKVVAEILRERFGDMLDVLVEGNQRQKWENLDSKTHLHVYRHSDTPALGPLALPYHTDNGLYVLLTPSSSLPLRALSKNGTMHVLDTGDDTVLLLLGTGLTKWLLPSSSLHAPSHGLPSLPTSLTSPRTVMARMTVAPAASLPSSSPSSSTFDIHFSAPLNEEKGLTLARLRKARSTDCSQDWPHACEHDRRKRETDAVSVLTGCSV